MSHGKYGRFGPLVGSIDEGTSSARFIIFSARTAEVIALHQIPLKALYPQEGFVEQDPKEIISAVYHCIENAIEKLNALEISESDIVAVGITNQRETALAWNKVTGEPLYNALDSQSSCLTGLTHLTLLSNEVDPRIFPKFNVSQNLKIVSHEIALVNNLLVWSDIRTQPLAAKLIEELPDKSPDHFKRICGLPITSTFSALKFRWFLEEVPAVKAAADENSLCFGTIDSWLIYNLTGGKNNGAFMTDCTNASRTLLMNLELLNWDPRLCKFFKIKSQWLPEIRSSSEIYGYLDSGILNGVPISGCLGDQQAALLGHMCLESGQAKNTYGTGCFLLCNTGSSIVNSRHGLITTVAFKLGKNVPVKYAIEGSVAVAGSAFNWLKENLEILDDAKSAEAIAEAVTETNDLYFVPAFSGLYAPYWCQDARGVIVGITEETKVSHLIRAALEAVCFQTRDVLEAMEKDCGFSLKQLLVDGGMTKNSLLMQLQADLTGISVVRPGNSEMTALGVALAAGSAEGVQVWNFDRAAAPSSKVFWPSITSKERDSRYSKWKDAVERSFGWKNDSKF